MTIDQHNQNQQQKREQAAKAAAKSRRIYDAFFNRAAPKSGK